MKRSRRRAFAILRTAPAWLRATLATGLSGLRGPDRDRLDAAVVDSLGAGGTLATGSGFPFLRASSDASGCADCRRCVAACPSQCLFLEVGAETQVSAVDAAAAAGLRRFEVEPGRCIGCGECVEVCPDELLELRSDPSRVGEGAAPARRSLLVVPDEGGHVP